MEVKVFLIVQSTNLLLVCHRTKNEWKKVPIQHSRRFILFSSSSAGKSFSNGSLLNLHRLLTLSENNFFFHQKNKIRRRTNTILSYGFIASGDFNSVVNFVRCSVFDFERPLPHHQTAKQLYSTSAERSQRFKDMFSYRYIILFV